MKRVLSLISLFLLASCSSPQSGGSNKNYAFQIVNNTKAISISLKADFNIENEDELKIESLPPMQEFTYKALPAADILDSEDTSYDYGSASLDNGSKILYYFKYTFYLKNNSEADTTYNLKFYVKEAKENISERSLISTIRFMIFENSSNDEHNYGVYAKQGIEKNIDINGNYTYNEFISVRPGNGSRTEDAEHPLVTASFLESGNEGYIRLSNDNFKVNEIMRYTLVVWLEGEDADSISTEAAPIGSSLKIGAELSR